MLLEQSSSYLEVMYKNNGLSAEYAEIKLPATYLNGHAYQREIGASA